ncbi:hypothetical_protein [Leishmania braziliensis MHOM/BR/75/M2904]|uniref:Hypothetical_protein n=1 Tax=Leishmania braziliensis MHOM/BR/75/M2904 TaxID=420245 RepID=A0A3P3ZCQ7_LEIBR|nr:hypothetical_protein [Leishmania braziliensis MHOM/BR/75/M2904]
MTVSHQCVRISLFQCTPLSDTNFYQAYRTSQADGRFAAKQPLLRSRAADYRGDVLIPLASISSSPQQSLNSEATSVTLHQLRIGLEARLSNYCVLHVPAARTRSFVEEHRLTPSHVSLSPAAAESCAPKDVPLLSRANEGQNGNTCEGPLSCLSDRVQFLCCASCSSSVVAEAAAVSRKVPTVRSAPPGLPPGASDGTPNAPWIRINQLQRMGIRSSDATLQTPLPPVSIPPPASHAPMRTVEEWMLQQHDSMDVFLTSAEAASAGAVDAESDSTGGVVEGGACYAAFFSLTMLPAAERAKKLMLSLAQSPEPAATTSAPQSLAAFTVRAHHHTLRMGLPPPTSAGKDDASKTLLNPPTLREVIIDRLRLQRGVHVKRLLDPMSGAAVLPCESAATLLAAQIVGLEAECSAPPAAHSKQEDEVTQRLAPRSLLEAPQQSSSASTRPRASGPRAETASDLFNHLVGLRAHYHADHYYYDGADASGWAEKRTLISMSELPSESELRLTFPASLGSSQTPLYSSTRLSTASSGAASSLVLSSTENSSSLPIPFLQEDALRAVIPGPSDSVGFTGNSARMEPHTSTETSVDVQEQYGSRAGKVPSDQSGSSTFLPLLNVEAETAPLSPVEEKLEGMRDSLCDMNDVFIYEDEETVMGVDFAGNGGTGDGSSGSQRRERRSSLVWSTPVARGSGAVRMPGDKGFGATPLMYRTSTRLSRSPSTPPVAVSSEAATTTRNERPTQRLVFAVSLSSTAAHSQSLDRSTSLEVDKVTALGSGDDGDVTSAGEVTGDMGPHELSRKISDSDDDEAVALDAPSGEVHNRDVAEQGTNEATDKSLMSDVSVSAAPPASVLPSVMSSTDSGIPSAPPSSSMNSSSRARSDSPSTLFDEATPSVRQDGAVNSSREVQVALPALLQSALSPDLPSLARPLPSPHSHRPSYAAALVQLDEKTTPIAPCSTPLASRSGTSEHELRSHIRGLNPLATQTSSEHSSQGASLAAVQRSLDRWNDKSADRAAALYGDDGSSTARKRSRTREVIALHSCDSRPLAVARVEGAQVTTLCSSSISSDGSDDASIVDSFVSTPSTIVATRPARTRSPIILSPEELSRMVLNVTTADAAQTRSSSMEPPLRHTAELHLDDASDASEHTPGNYGYGGYIASYALPNSDACDDLERNDGWGYISQHPSTRHSHDGSPTQHSENIVLRHASQSSYRQNASPTAVAASTEEAVTMTTPAHHLKHTQHRPSLSLSTSDQEMWMRFSDEGSGSAASDADCHMLVTQQEIPLYTRHSSSSAESDMCGSTSSGDGSVSDAIHT